MIFAYVAITLYGPAFQRASTNNRIGNSTVAGPTTPASPEGETGLGCCDFARHYYRNRGFFLFLQVLRWFTSLGSLAPDYGFVRPYEGFCPYGFPHSEIPGSMPACGSPKLIAACHVFLRRLLPRHPPCALSSLTIKLTRGTCAFRWSSFAIRKLFPGKAQTHRINSIAPPCSSHA